LNSFLTNYHEFCVIDSWFSFTLLVDGLPREYSLLENKDGYNYFLISGDDELLGKTLEIAHQEEKYPIDVTRLALRKDFDEHYATNEVLGANVKGAQTEFSLWAPFASKVVICLHSGIYELKRGNKGRYSITINQNLDGESYFFKVTLNNHTFSTSDPYAKSSIQNGELSVVIDESKYQFNAHESLLPKLVNKLSSVIYEGHVRDLTSSNDTNIEHKGCFLGLCETNKVSINNIPVGLDYLKLLGITHLQLQPVLRYNDDEYNWGYDVLSFFDLEPSYSTKPSDYSARIQECQTLVSKLHESGIRVVFDVVYNHVYNVETHSLNLITPHYFFREKNGKLSNCSGCGNDFASERLMGRKIILDSIKYLLEFYHIDGFRFDLMGLLDIKTMQEIEALALSLKKDVMLYGEGWDMFAETFNNEKLATISNSHFLPNYSFFNNSYRDIVRGHGMNTPLDEPGFMLCNTSYQDGFKFAFLGSSTNITYPALFNHISQSINYVECHDNATIYDAVVESTELDEMRIVKYLNKTLLCSFGIPFIHNGQEFGQSKRSQTNTYKSGDFYNQLDYKLRDERMEIVQSFIHFIEQRKNNPLFQKEIELSNVEFIDIKPGILQANIDDCRFYFNSSSKSYNFKDSEYFELNSNDLSEYHVIAPYRCCYYVKRI